MIPLMEIGIIRIKDMYYGSKYCSSCKYNRSCFMQAQIAHHNKVCIILDKVFEQEWKNENKLK